MKTISTWVSLLQYGIKRDNKNLFKIPHWVTGYPESGLMNYVIHGCLKFKSSTGTRSNFFDINCIRQFSCFYNQYTSNSLVKIRKEYRMEAVRLAAIPENSPTDGQGSVKVNTWNLFFFHCLNHFSATEANDKQLPPLLRLREIPVLSLLLETSNPDWGVSRFSSLRSSTAFLSHST